MDLATLLFLADPIAERIIEALSKPKLTFVTLNLESVKSTSAHFLNFQSTFTLSGMTFQNALVSTYQAFATGLTTGLSIFMATIT